MPQNKQLLIKMDDASYDKLKDAVKEKGIISTSAYVRNAINFYMTIDKLENADSLVIGTGATRAIERTLQKYRNELEQRNRIILILLNLIWHRVNYDARISSDDLERLVRDAIKEIDNGNLTTSNLFATAKKERVTRIVTSEKQRQQRSDQSATNTNLAPDQDASTCPSTRSSKAMPNNRTDVIHEMYADVFPRKKHD